MALPDMALVVVSANVFGNVDSLNDDCYLQ